MTDQVAAAGGTTAVVTASATIPQQLNRPSLDLPAHIPDGVRALIDGLPEPLRTAVIAAVNTPGGVKITNGNAKGGVMKTTLSMYFAFILALTGEPVLLVDADDTNKTCLKWQAAVGEAWPASITVVPYSGPLMAKQVTDLMARGYKHLVIDVGPTDVGVLKTAWALTKRGIVPTQQHVGDLVQLATTFNLLSEMGEQIDLSVLIARSFPKRSSYGRGRVYVEDMLRGANLDFPQGLPTVSLLGATIPLLEPIAETWGTIPNDFAFFSSVLAEVLGVPRAEIELLEKKEAA